MDGSVKRQIRAFALLTLAGGALVGGSAGAQAGCRQQIINRSSYLAVASLDGGRSFAIPPRRSRSLRLATSGRLDIAAYCTARGRRGLLPVGAPVAQDAFDTVAILDRCYYDLGLIGHGAPGSAPFVLNAPRQGDLVVGPFRASCAPDR